MSSKNLRWPARNPIPLQSDGRLDLYINETIALEGSGKLFHHSWALVSPQEVSIESRRASSDLTSVAVATGYKNLTDIVDPDKFAFQEKVIAKIGEIIIAENYDHELIAMRLESISIPKENEDIKPSITIEYCLLPLLRAGSVTTKQLQASLKDNLEDAQQTLNSIHDELIRETTMERFALSPALGHNNPPEDFSLSIEEIESLQSVFSNISRKQIFIRENKSEILADIKELENGRSKLREYILKKADLAVDETIKIGVRALVGLPSLVVLSFILTEKIGKTIDLISEIIARSSH